MDEGEQETSGYYGRLIHITMRQAGTDTRFVFYNRPRQLKQSSLLSAGQKKNDSQSPNQVVKRRAKSRQAAAFLQSNKLMF